MAVMNWSKEAKVDLLCRVGAALSLATTAFHYPSPSAESFQSTQQGAKIRNYPGCGIGDVPEMMIVFRDDPKIIRGVVIGIQKNRVEVFPRYTRGYQTYPATTLFTLRGGLKDPQGNQITLEAGDRIVASAYPAQEDASPEDVFRISALRTENKPFVSAESTIPDCSQT